jgi:diguanylate cyclase (GGDEF)-like protein/PAS domain S-box-containing protein
VSGAATDEVSELQQLRKELEETRAEARRSNERLQLALQGTLDCVTILDREFRFTFINQRAVAERDLGAIIGQSIYKVFPGTENTVFGHSYERVMRTRVPETVEGFFPPLGCWYEGYTAPCDEGIIVFFRNMDARKRAEAAWQESENRLRTTLDSVPQIIWSSLPDGTCDYFNKPWYEFTGVDAGHETMGCWHQLVHPDDRQAVQQAWRHSLATGVPLETQCRIRHHSGRHSWILARARAERAGDGAIRRWHGTCIDINGRVLADQARHASEALNRSIVEASADCIKMLDLDGYIVFVNEAGRRVMTPADGADMLGSRWIETLPESAAPAAEKAMAAALEGGVGHFTMCLAPVGAPAKWWDVAVTPVRDDTGQPIGLVAVSRDITHQKSTEERVRWTATHDSLTQLPNRVLFRERLDHAIKACGVSGGRLALLLLDADDFKQINDALGHDAGDRLLCTLAERLRTSAQQGDVVARLGGDEFAILLHDPLGDADVIDRANAILATLKAPFIHAGRVLDCGATIGASLYPAHGSGTSELLKNADIALYVAKSASRGRVKIFESQMRDAMQSRVSMLALARDALRSDLITPFYQPKINFDTGRVIGFEALLRWRHPSRGVQLPDTISAAFEDLDVAASISDRMIERAIADMRHWLDRGIDFGHVAINASAAEFRRGDFAERLLERLDAAAIPTHRVQLEVTETVFLGRGADCVEQALQTLSSRGMCIALDDFGTGYASLSHLKQFPVSIIKIDRSFVRDLEEDPDDAAIIRAVINLGQSLNIEIVAEGIETAAQHDFLVGLGCTYGQGFLYGKASPAADVPSLLAGARSVPASKAA